MSNASGWAVELALTKAALTAAGMLRLQADVELRFSEEAIWLRGPGEPDAPPWNHLLPQLPARGLYRVADDDHLTPINRAVPTGVLPTDHWQPIKQALLIAPAHAALPGDVPPPATMGLRRGGAMAQANVLLTDHQVWEAWASQAPAVRLRRLATAAAADGSVVVRGTPLPPVSGDRLVETEGVAAPVGMTWTPPVPAALLRQALSATPEDLVFFTRDGRLERVAGDDFVQASRAGARLTSKALAGPAN